MEAFLSNIVPMDEHAVRKAYARWAPVYDLSFGKIADAGRIIAVDAINKRRGSVLEVGVGTGISLPRYRPHLDVTGIDLSPEMLNKARERVNKLGLRNIRRILEMDAQELDFEDDSFDTVVAMYVLTVVPEPAKVMAELERVCKPGGQILIINHFSQEHGVRGMVEKAMAPFAERLGWRPEFGIENVMTQDNLRLVEERPMKPFGLFTMLRFTKEETPGGTRSRPRTAAERSTQPISVDQEVRDVAI
jgi:phosphatidylethanolamine/phosphatidyl-N-methylethanolamine N-methyltransferase